MPELAEQQSIAPVAQSNLCEGQISTFQPRTRSTISRGYTLQLLRVGVPLALADALAVFTTLCVLSLFSSVVPWNTTVVAGMVALYLLGFWAAGIYPGIGLHPARELRQLFRVSVVMTVAVTFLRQGVVGQSLDYALVFIAGQPLQLMLLPIFRSLMKSIMRRLKLSIPFYFLGHRRDVLKVSRDMGRFEWTMLRGVGRFSRGEEATFDDHPAEDKLDGNEELAFERSVVYMGTPDQIVPLAEKGGVYWLIVVADEGSPYLRNCPREVLESFPQLIRLSATPSTWCAGSSLVNCGLASGVRVEEALLLPGARFTKRLLDLMFSLSMGICLLPLFVAIAALIRLTTRGPIFYCHRRIGKFGRTFRAWKFSSMRPNAEHVLEQYLNEHPELRAEWEHNHKLKNDPRVTTIGAILRKTSLDELPQLWNILRGEMSLVGPRPIVNEEIEKYGDTFRIYLRVTPGLTGLWQISGRNNTSYAERLAYDRYYVQHWSPWLDMYILMRTVKTVCLCEGAY